MDFDLDETHRDLRDLAADVLAREAATDRLDAHERTGDAYDAATWRALARAGLLGALVPEEHGGAGLGAIALTVVLREAGVRTAPVPAYATLALAALPLALHGTGAQKALLAGVASGETILTGAYREAGPAGEVRATARREGDRHLVTGVKTFVPFAAQAARILVPARTEDGEIAVFLVEPDAATLTDHPSATTDPLYRVELDGAPGDPLGPGAWTTLRRTAVLGAVALASGVIDGALTLTADYVKTREQFGRPLAQFQAVTMNVGDVYIAKRALDVAVWSAAWRTEHGDPDADLAVAAYNAAGPVVQALYTCQHLHGGIGLDVTYPLHRSFAWGKHAGHLLGGADDQLDTLGALVAQEV
ncbi:acyl-CoA dehydrogenase family protein [Actinomadura flavalba]|uniref:acyl-CoA dehydrogenase family protein n=1 Tax=Actinomadura flavalba TaxID=1120938 RepID=UPI00037FD6DD|nr:acyl-CoA dehydrogenase family protein [Actinomadura flavalba]